MIRPARVQAHRGVSTTLGTRILPWVLDYYPGYSGTTLGTRVLLWVLGYYLGYSGTTLGSRVLPWEVRGGVRRRRHRRTGGRTDGRTDGQTDGLTDGQTTTTTEIKLSELWATHLRENKAVFLPTSIQTASDMVCPKTIAKILRQVVPGTTFGGSKSNKLRSAGCKMVSGWCPKPA